MCPSSIDTLSGDRRYLGRVYEYSRVMDAPRGVVFAAWTEARQLAHWWGPEGFTNPVCEIDPRPEGMLHIDMRDPEGVMYPLQGTVREVVPPERLAFTASLGDDHGHAIFEVLTTVTLTPQKSRTKVHVHVKVLAVTAGASLYLDGMEEGWPESLVRLEIRVLAALNAAAKKRSDA